MNLEHHDSRGCHPYSGPSYPEVKFYHPALERRCWRCGAVFCENCIDNISSRTGVEPKYHECPCCGLDINKPKQLGDLVIFAKCEQFPFLKIRTGTVVEVTHTGAVWVEVDGVRYFV